MTSTPLPITDPVALVEGLDPKAIRARLDAIYREREALVVLLSAAERRERCARPSPDRQEVAPCR